MNKERELLRQALEAWDNEDDVTLIHEVLEEIRTYLSTPSDEAKKPVGYQWLHSGHFSKQIPKNANAIEWYPLYLHPPRPAEPEAEYDFYGVIPLTHRKAKGIIKDRGYHVTGFVLSRPDGDKCIVDMSAVRWLSGKEFFEMMHPPVVSPTAEPEAETIETLKAENFKLASGQCTEGGPWGDEGGTPYCKYAKRKPMTEEEIEAGFRYGDVGYTNGFFEGIRFAEKHHGITNADL